MEFIIDRFEGEFAVCEDENKKMVNIKKQFLPKNSKEGDVLKFENGKYIVDEKQTQDKRDENFDLLSKLLKK